MPRVLVSDSISEEGVNRLRDHGYEVDIQTDLDQDEIISIIPSYDALIVRSGTKVTADVIDAATNLKIVGRAGVGVDNIDIDAATEKGVIVANAPEGNTVAAAEHAVSLLLSLSRNIPQANNSLKRGEWRKSDFIGVEVKNKTLGVLGLGRIGREVASRLYEMGMDVIAYDPFVSNKRADEVGAELYGLDYVLENADFISVHTPLNDDTHHLISEDELSSMKDSARLVHASRGGVVDEDAVADAVENGIISGSAFDVFEDEPPSKENRLLDLDDVVVTPHLGASTEKAQLNVATRIAEQVINVLDGGVAETALNAPTLKKEAHEEIKPYIELAETLGALLVQISDPNINQLEIEYSGEIADVDVSPLTVSLQKGFLEPILDDPVNFVNAPKIMESRGVKITESKTGHSEDFVSLITVRSIRNGEGSEVAGTLFGKTDPTIVRINGYRVDAPPYGHMLIVKNVDKPGMIGKVGTLLGEYDINIAGMHNGRNEIGGEAIMILNVDNEVSREIRDKLTEVEGIKNARYVSL